MRHRRSQMPLLIMVALIVLLIIVRMIITRAGDAAIERVKQENELKKLKEELQQQKQLESGKDPVMEELQKRVDAAHDPLEELKPRATGTGDSSD